MEASANSTSVEDRINLHQLMELKAEFDKADTDQGGSLDMEEASPPVAALNEVYESDPILYACSS